MSEKIYVPCGHKCWSYGTKICDSFSSITGTTVVYDSCDIVINGVSNKCLRIEVFGDIGRLPELLSAEYRTKCIM